MSHCLGGKAPLGSGNKASNYKYENGKSPAQQLFWPGDHLTLMVLG